MQRLHFALLVLLVAAAIALARFRVSTPEPARPDLLSIALPRAALLISLDIQALRAEKDGPMLMDQVEALLHAAAPLKRCPASLLGEVTRIALVIPAESAAQGGDDVAILAEGAFRANAVLECAAALIEVRDSELVRSNVGPFAVLRDRKSTGEIAVRDGGPLISSGGAYFRELLARAGGAATPARGPREELHAALRAELGPEPLLATLVLAPGWLDRWLGDLSGAGSPLAAARAVALTATLADPVVLHAVIGAKDAAGAEEIERFVRQLLPGEGMLLAHPLGLGGVRLVGATRNEQRVSLEISFPANLLAETWRQLAPTN